MYDIQNKRGCFIGAGNSAMAASSRLPVTHRADVFNTHCMSLYGCQQWNLSHNNSAQLETSWNIAVRHIYNVDYQTHRNLFPALTYSLNLDDTLLLRIYTFLKFNVLLNNCTHNAFVNNHHNDVRSCIGDNLLHLKCRLNMSHCFVLHRLKPVTFIKSLFSNLPLYECPIGDCLHELLCVKDNLWSLSGLILLTLMILSVTSV